MREDHDSAVCADFMGEILAMHAWSVRDAAHKRV